MSRRPKDTIVNAIRRQTKGRSGGKRIYPLHVVTEGDGIQLICTDGTHEYAVFLPCSFLRKFAKKQEDANMYALTRPSDIGVRVTTLIAERGLIGPKWLKGEM